MSWPIRKKALFFGVLLALGALLAPGIGRICQAAADRSMAAHPCCQDKAQCDPQFNSESCCQTSHSSSRHSIPVPQANLEIAKFFPFLALLTPTLQGLATFSQCARTTIAVFPIPPPFLSHHAFLC